MYYRDLTVIGLSYVHPEKCFVESTKISIGPYLNEKLC